MNNVFSNPSGEEGRKNLGDMNEHHRPLSEWALSLIPETKPRRILDVGCGGGMLISLLAEKYPDAMIDGIDISDDAVEFSRKVNEENISNGRCTVRKASAEDIPFEEGLFDLVISCESYFFWNDLIGAMDEISRVTTLGGYVVIVSEAYPDPKFDEINKRHAEMYGMELRSNQYMEALIGSYGFDVKVHTVPEKNWVTFVGKKTSLSSF